MDKLQLKMAERQKIEGEAQTILAKGADNITSDELKLLREKNSALVALDAEIADLKDLEEIAQGMEQRRLDAGEVPNPNKNAPATGGEEYFANLNYEIPFSAKARRVKHLSAVCPDHQIAQKVAYGLGKWGTAVLFGLESSLEWCKKNHIPVTKAQSETVNSGGGFLVPPQFADYIIALVEQFGVARRLCKLNRMKGDTLSIPRRAGAPNVYFVDDGVSITPGQKRWDMVTITAKKLASIILFSSEIAEDAMVDIGDDLAKELAWLFSYMEDNCLFNGDGTSTYGGILGVGPAITAAFTGGSGSPGIIVQGTTGQAGKWSAYTPTDFENCMAALPGLAWKMGRPSWYCTQQFFYGAMVPLMAAAGGNRITDIAAGAKELIFMGSKVEITQVLTTTSGESQYDAFFGDLSLAVEFGARRDLTIATSTEFAFENDQIAIRGIERFGITCANVGGRGPAAQAINPKNAADGNTNIAGPIVALKSAAS